MPSPAIQTNTHTPRALTRTLSPDKGHVSYPAGTGVSPSTPNKSAKQIPLAKKKARRASRSGSAHSDIPTVSAKRSNSPVHESKFDLQKDYPSVLISAEHLRALKGSGDVDTMRAVAQVFSNCLLTVVQNIDHLLNESCQHSGYQDARAGVMFVSDLFSSRGANPTTNLSEAEKVDDVNMILDMMEMVISNVATFLRAAEKIHLEAKPLPSLPSIPSSQVPIQVPIIVVTEEPSNPSSPSHSPTSTQSDLPLVKRKSLAVIATEVIKENEGGISWCSSASASASSPSLLAPPPKDVAALRTIRPTKSGAQKSNMIQSILFKARNTSLLSFTTSAAARLAEETQSFLEDLHTSAETLNNGNVDLPYDPRQSALYFPVDPLNPDIDVELPPLSEDAMAVRLDSQGQLKAASLTALIRLLTSKDIITDRYLCEIFFFSFRFYLSPREVVQKLIDRYDEPMPNGTVAQIDVWIANQVDIVRPRVLSLIQKWLYQYWLPDIDNATALELLQSFLLKELPTGKIPQETGAMLLQGVYSVQAGELSRQAFLRRHYERIASGSMIRELEPSGFKLKLDASKNTAQQFLQFNTKAGREELARQLTIKASELFGALDPEGVVRFWLEDKKAEEATREEEQALMDAANGIDAEIDKIDVQAARLQDQMESLVSLSERKAKLITERDEVIQKLIALRIVAEAHRNAVQEAESRCFTIVHWERSLHLFVIHSILHFVDTPSQRVDVIYFWWRVCAICLRLNNFSCATTIFVATTNACISRLRETLSLMDSEMRSLYASLNPFFADRKKYSDKMFEILDRRTEPVVPSLPALKRNIDILAEAIPSKVAIKPGEQRTGINLYPFRIIGKTISSMELAQMPYKLSCNSRIQDWLSSQLSSFNPLQEEEIMCGFDRRSDKLEPRASVPPVVRRVCHDPWTQCVRKVRVKGQIVFRVYSLGDPKMPAQLPYTPEDFESPTSSTTSSSTGSPVSSSTQLSDKENAFPTIRGSPTKPHSPPASPVKRSRAPSLVQPLVQRIMKR